VAGAEVEEEDAVWGDSSARLVTTKVDLKHLADGCRRDTAPHKHLKRD
jgi:hypothetical protein